MEAAKNRKGIADVVRGDEEAEEEELSPTTSISIDTTSVNGVRKYRGTFTYRVPTMGDHVDIAALRSRYTQQLESVEGFGGRVAEALAYLHTTVSAEKAPAWWRDSDQGVKLHDPQPLLALYAEARAYEARFLGGGGDDARGSEGDAPEAEPTDAATGDDLESDVEPPAERRKVLATFGKGSDRADPGRESA